MDSNEDMKIPTFALILLSLCIIPVAYCEDKTTIKDKLDSITIALPEFPGVPAYIVFEVIQELRVVSTANLGVNIVLRPGSHTEAIVTMEASKMNLKDALEAIAKQLKCEVTTDHGAVVIGPSKGKKVGVLGAKSEVFTRKLKSIKLPSVEFHATPIKDAAKFFEKRTKIMDASGTGIVIQVAKLKPKKDELGFVSDDYRLSDLKLSKISLFDALHHVAAQAGVTVTFMSDRAVFSN